MIDVEQFRLVVDLSAATISPVTRLASKARLG
jgi:hypothetical protein